jgi:hypothetical protein
MSRYAAWTDVEDIWPEAGAIEDNATAQNAVIDQASAVVDAFLSPVMITPIGLELSGSYPDLIILGTAAIAAHLVARRRQTGDDDQWNADYGGRNYYGSRFLHEGLSLYLQPLYEARAALPEQVTPAETIAPKVVESFTTTTGTAIARYSGGRYLGDKPTSYVITISSSGGTVAGNDLTITIVRDNDETIVTDLSISSSGWHGVENGLQISFKDPASSPVWTEDEYITITCEPVTLAVVGGTMRSVDLPLG